MKYHEEVKSGSTLKQHGTPGRPRKMEKSARPTSMDLSGLALPPSPDSPATDALMRDARQRQMIDDLMQHKKAASRSGGLVAIGAGESRS